MARGISITEFRVAMETYGAKLEEAPVVHKVNELDDPNRVVSPGLHAVYPEGYVAPSASPAPVTPAPVEATPVTPVAPVAPQPEIQQPVSEPQVVQPPVAPVQPVAPVMETPPVAVAPVPSWGPLLPPPRFQQLGATSCT